MDVDGKAYQVEILDTAGQDEYTPLRANFMHTGDGFLLVYSVLDDQTFEELRSIREQILQAHPNKAVNVFLLIDFSLCVAFITSTYCYRFQ